MAPKPTLHPKRKRELAEVGIGPQGEGQFSQHKRDKSLERTVRSTNNQPKKDTIMDTATQRHVHEVPATAEPSPERIGQMADRAVGQVDQLTQAMLQSRRPAYIAQEKMLDFVVAVSAVVAGTALFKWLFGPKVEVPLSPLPGVKK
jgi:hypothetical protein